MDSYSNCFSSKQIFSCSGVRSDVTFFMIHQSVILKCGFSIDFRVQNFFGLLWKFLSIHFNYFLKMLLLKGPTITAILFFEEGIELSTETYNLRVWTLVAMRSFQADVRLFDLCLGLHIFGFKPLKRHRYPYLGLSALRDFLKTFFDFTKGSLFRFSCISFPKRGFSSKFGIFWDCVKFWSFLNINQIF